MKHLRIKQIVEIFFSKFAFLKGNRVVTNASWIIGCRIGQAVLGLVLTMASARYLGPSGYGLISYAAALVAFVGPIMRLGLDATLVHEVISSPEKEGETLGTALLLCGISAIACILGLLSFVFFVNHGEKDTLLVCALYSVLLIFQASEMLQYWFQAKLLSKYTSVVSLIAYASMSIYRLALLLQGSSIYWFALSQALDSCIISIALWRIYKKRGPQKLTFSCRRAQEMLARSKYYIISSMMMVIYGETDRIMLKAMLDEAAVGYYAAAATCAGMTSFVFGAIIDSFRPSILEKKRICEDVFESRVILLYSIVFYLSLAQSIGITLFSGPIVHIIYGQDYNKSIGILRLLVWQATFSYIGSVRNIWILAEGKQRYLWRINLAGAIANVFLNLSLIPIWGAGGAAVATVATQIFTNVIVGVFIAPIRRSVYLLKQSLNIKMLYRTIKSFGGRC